MNVDSPVKYFKWPSYLQSLTSTFRSHGETSPLSASNEEDLSRRITAHEQTILAIPNQASRAETTIGASPIVGVVHYVYSCTRTGAWLNRHAVLELDDGEAISVRWRAIPRGCQDFHYSSKGGCAQ
jgi:hypothetical protein